MRPSTLTTPTGKKWSTNRIYYTPNPNDTVKFTTNLMGSLIYENIDRTFGYTYNGSGNISKITDKTGTVSKDSTFVYDEANQLIRENNAYTNKTVTYTYDAGGNILTKTEYPFTTGSLDGLTGTVINYTYGNTNWKDLLTAYNGKAITYDEIGNPLTYYNGTTFTWERGRKLATATTADGTAVSYLYNDSGIRTQKTVNGVATEYFLDGSNIIAEKTGNDVKWYYYDGDGTREAIEYKGNVYYYFYNAQGDVMGLFDNNLNVVVNYTYDSWGNVVSITGSMADTLGQDNPFRYRGYYYDNDTGLYYLNSRYYDANTGRFINADGLVQTGQGLLDKNMFAYCANNPINCLDPLGNCWHRLWLWDCPKCAAEKMAGGLISGVGTVVSNMSNYQKTVDEASQDYETHVANVVNYNCTVQSKPQKPYLNKKLNKKLKPNSRYSRYAYSGIKTLALMEGYDLTQMTWNDVQNHPDLESKILGGYIIWDNASPEVIAKVYGYEYGIELACDQLLPKTSLVEEIYNAKKI